MSTLKLKKKPSTEPRARRPLRGGNSLLTPRPTLAEREAQRAAQPPERRYEPRQRDQSAELLPTRGPGPAMREFPRSPPESQEPRRPFGPRQPARNTAFDSPGSQRPAAHGHGHGHGGVDRSAFAARESMPEHGRAHPPRGEFQRRPSPHQGASGAEFRRPEQRPFDARHSEVRHSEARHSEPRYSEVRRPEPQRSMPRPLHAPHQGHQTPAQEGMRLSKRMSELGLASRREADDWIAKGWVRVDGKVVNELGSRVRPGQLITIDTPAKFHQARKVTILLNKPVGYVSGQAEDGHEPAWVLIKPDTQWREDTSGIRFKREHVRGLAPAGRLDIDSVGLLVLTQDGGIAKQLIGEDSQVEKEYLVRVAPLEGQGRLSAEGLALLNHGLSLDGVELKPAQVEWINEDQLRFVLREGRKRQIRRMCEAVGLKVVGLKRVRIGQVTLGHLPPGAWRYLRHDEAFESPGQALHHRAGRVEDGSE